jgi:WD40 repeat protein
VSATQTDVASADALLHGRGVSRNLDAYVGAVAFAGSAVAFALGDGTLRLIDLGDREAWRTIEAHDGGVLSLAGGPFFASGGDDGKLQRVAPDGTLTTVASFGSKWVDHVAVTAAGGKPLIAASVGKSVHVFDASGEKLKELVHPSTVTGVVFDAKGKRVCASHYNGTSLWFVAAKTDTPRVLEWKGSHIGIVISPDGDAVVTAMQENALHGWRLSDGQHMRMSGYPSKTRGMGFTRNGKWLATSGAESVVLWPFFGGGPMGKAPTELASGDEGVLCTMIACHPQQEMVAAGFSDGLVVLADVGTSRVLPVAAPGRGSVSAMGWSGDGSALAFGTEDGFAAVVDLSKRS